MKSLTLIVLFASFITASSPSIASADSSSPPASVPSPSEKPKAAGLVNINTATQKELEKVPRVGKKLAERIIAGRPYASVDDLKRIDGFGKKTFAAASPHLTVE